MVRVSAKYSQGEKALQKEIDKSSHKLNIDRVSLKNAIKSLPPAFVLFNTIYYRKDLYQDDFVPEWPTPPIIQDAKLLAHEITHIWQWQNREITGYHPLMALSEHIEFSDPYYYEIENGKLFVEYRYEQQAEIVGDYVEQLYWERDPVQLKLLSNLIEQVFPSDEISRGLAKLCLKRSDYNCQELRKSLQQVGTE